MNKKKLLILFIIFILFVSVLIIFYSIDNKRNFKNISRNTKQNSENISINADDDLLYENLKTISSHIRHYNSQGNISTAEFLKTTLKSYGYTIETQDFNIYKQDFSSLIPTSNWDFLDLDPLKSDVVGVGHNIIAKSSNFDKNKKNLYITAHYDSTDTTSGVIDNATGSSIAIEISRILKNYVGDFNINFIFFDAEEYCRYGSKYFISNMSNNEAQSIIGAINLDMIGEKNAGNLIIQTPSTNENILSILLNNSLENKLEVIEAGTSDDLSFYMGKIPAITLTDKNSNLMLANESTETQLQNVDISILKKTSELISKFIANLAFDNYNYLLKVSSTPMSIDIIDTFPSLLKNINDFTLIDIKSNLIENGYDKETQYIYRNLTGKEFIVKETFGAFVPKDYKSEFINLNNDLNWYYKKTNDKIIFKSFNRVREVSGDISSDEAFAVLEQYYIYEYNTVFNENPPKKLFE